MLSCLDMNMSRRLHLHVIMKCAYVHDDIIDHESHKGLRVQASIVVLPRVHPYTSACCRKP